MTYTPLRGCGEFAWVFCEISPRVENSQLDGTKPPSCFWKYSKSEKARVRARAAQPTSRPSPTGAGSSKHGPILGPVQKANRGAFYRSRSRRRARPGAGRGLSRPRGPPILGAVWLSAATCRAPLAKKVISDWTSK